MSRELVREMLEPFSAQEFEGQLSCNLPIPDSGRSQQVMVLFTETGFWITSPFADAEQLAPKMAFKLGLEAAYGIAEVEGIYYVKHFIFFDEMVEKFVLLHCYAVAICADRLEEYSGKDIY